MFRKLFQKKFNKRDSGEIKKELQVTLDYLVEENRKLREELRRVQTIHNEIVSKIREK